MVQKMGRFALPVLLVCAVLTAESGAAARALLSRSGHDFDNAQPPQSQPLVMGVRIGEHPASTRFVLELSDPVTPRVFTLASPDRLVVDLPDVLWRIGA